MERGLYPAALRFTNSLHHRDLRTGRTPQNDSVASRREPRRNLQRGGIMKKTLAAVVAAGAMFAAGAVADDGGRDNRNNTNIANNQSGNGHFSSSIIGSMPGMTVGPVASGGAPWTVTAGQATVDSSGQLSV